MLQQVWRAQRRAVISRIELQPCRRIPMKQRLLVMNGQKLLQSEQGGQWATTKVDKAGSIKPGIYNIHLAMPADKAKSHDGLVLHLDKEHLYQQVGKVFIRHALEDFGKAPETGSSASISYDGDKAIVAVASVKQSRGLKR
jgi:cell filamentation protein